MEDLDEAVASGCSAVEIIEGPRGWYEPCGSAFRRR